MPLASITKPAPGALPCPFCGSVDVRNWSSDDHDPGNPAWSMMCLGCECEGPHCGSEAESVALWNRRLGFDPAAGLDQPDPAPTCPPVYPPDAHPGARLHWLLEPEDGDLIVAEWDLSLTTWWLMGTDVNHSPEEIGAGGYTWHSIVIVPEQ